MSISTIINKLRNKKILLLGFGKEGASGYAFIRKHLPQIPITIANLHELTDTSAFTNDPNTHLLIGEHYLDTINNYDIVLKSPGISLKNIIHLIDKDKISSQTDLFLQAFSSQCIGVTGTKGKSTTASLIFHILNNLHPNSLLAGNIGIPLFDIIEQIDSKTKIVLELSSHQLEFIRKSPHISILLNLFEEHLDHYNSYEDYKLAKFNIARYQSENDYFIYNAADPQIVFLLNEKPVKSHCISGFSSELANSYLTDSFPLKGEHNLENVSAAITALSCVEDVDIQNIKDFFHSFKPLPHRLEFIGKFDDILFYNDSISTIPQASIAAVQALKNVNTIILGGFDRGIDYQPLIDFLENSEIENIIFTGEAGKRMLLLSNNLKDKQLFFKDSYSEIVFLAKKHTKKGSICLLSPAAASYDQFQNFEHRGEVFRELVSEQKLDVQ